MKKVIIITVIVIIIVVAIAWFVFLGHNPSAPSIQANTGSTGSLPVVTLSTSSYNPPTGNTITIGTSEGSVTMNNFYNSAERVSIDHTSILIEQTSTYNITYYAPDSSFNILISGTPVPDVQAQAEAAFLQILGISQADACKLNVEIGVPASVDPNYADQNLGLSFCLSGGAFQSQ